MQVVGPGCGVSNPKFNREETTSLSFFLSWGSMRNRPDLAWRLRSPPLVSSPTLTLHAGRPDPSSAAGAGHGAPSPQGGLIHPLVPTMDREPAAPGYPRPPPIPKQRLLFGFKLGAETTSYTSIHDVMLSSYNKAFKFVGLRWSPSDALMFGFKGLFGTALLHQNQNSL